MPVTLWAFRGDVIHLGTEGDSGRRWDSRSVNGPAAGCQEVCDPRALPDVPASEEGCEQVGQAGRVGLTMNALLRNGPPTSYSTESQETVP